MHACMHYNYYTLHMRRIESKTRFSREIVAVRGSVHGHPVKKQLNGVL